MSSLAGQALPAIGITIGHTGEDVPATQAHARAAEHAGLDVIGLGDSQTVFRELYGELMACALATERIRLGSVVSNCVTRLPAVTASAIATVAEASGGRAFLGIGTGQSATANAGAARGTIAGLRAYLAAVRLLHGKPGPAGIPCSQPPVVPLAWSSPPVPVIVHSGGPRSVQVAAEFGDGVLLRRGDKPAEELAVQVADFRARVAAAGRDPGVFEVWVYTPGLVCDDEYAAWDELSGLISARAMTMREESCPAEYRSALERYRARYDYTRHSAVNDRRNSDLLRSLGLFEYAATRYTMVSDHRGMQARLAGLREAGVDCVIFGGAVRGKQELIASLGALKSPAAASPLS